MTPPTKDLTLDDLFERRDDPDAVAEIAERFDRLATGIASRYARGKVDRGDVEQVARMGLIAAINRFDTSRGVRFTTYATRTIVGELKRHLRDKTWSVRVPRSLQERWLEVVGVQERLTQELGRVPSVDEIATVVGTDAEDVLDALEAGRQYTAPSLDAPIDTGTTTTRVDLLAKTDRRFAIAERWARVEPSLHALPERERHILYLRFFEGKSQSEIGREVGVSQMHVSRLLRRSLATVRETAGIG